MSTRLIVREDGGEVQVTLHLAGEVTAKPAGPAMSFTSPLAEAEREDLRWYLEDYLRAPYAVWEERGVEIQGKLETWGERLFETIFGVGKQGRDAYLGAQNGGPWELWFASTSPAFLGLPWELLKDPKRPTPLALELSGINRTIDVAEPAAEVAGDGGLRVLMIIARPAGRKDVGYRMIARPLLERLAPVSGEVAPGT